MLLNFIFIVFYVIYFVVLWISCTKAQNIDDEIKGIQ